MTEPRVQPSSVELTSADPGASDPIRCHGSRLAAPVAILESHGPVEKEPTGVTPAGRVVVFLLMLAPVLPQASSYPGGLRLESVAEASHTTASSYYLQLTDVHRVAAGWIVTELSLSPHLLHPLHVI